MLTAIRVLSMTDLFHDTPADPTLHTRGEGICQVWPKNLKKLSFLGGGSFFWALFHSAWAETFENGRDATTTNRVSVLNMLTTHSSCELHTELDWWHLVITTNEPMNWTSNLLGSVAICFQTLTNSLTSTCASYAVNECRPKHPLLASRPSAVGF